MRFKKVSSQFVRMCQWDTERFKCFRDEFHIVGYYWGYVRNSQYFVKLLQDGVSARPPYRNKQTYMQYIRHLHDFNEYTAHVLDHVMMWSLEDGRVICTSMPYSSHELTMAEFAEMAAKYSFPESIKLRFLDDKYKYRINGDFMLMIFDELQE